MKKFLKLPLLDRIYIAILLIIFGGIVLHAPISVGLGTIWPNYSLLIKSWKEILMLISGVIAILLLYKKRHLKILNDPIIIAIGVYALLHLVSIFFMNNGLLSILAGLAIDLRYVLFFVLIFIALKLYPEYKVTFIKVGIAGALVVMIFALMQIFILPADILKYIGYNNQTIAPYLTVDKNTNFIRINSTLRGPNPLGAYSMMVLAFVTSALINKKAFKNKKTKIITVTLAISGLAALWSSYSRSALFATIAACLLVLIISTWGKLSKKIFIITGLVCVVTVSSLFLFKNSSYISNVLLHENPTNIDNISSNAGHINSLRESLSDLIQQPFGRGVGSTGSASLFTNKPLIIENQYLFVAHETGWLGLALFLSILIMLFKRIWSLRKNWFALGLFASGTGMLLISLLLPILVDDTVSIVWWGLAAIALLTINKET